MSRTGIALDKNGVVMPTCLLIRVHVFSGFLVLSE